MKTITTVEELQELPTNHVIRDKYGSILEKAGGIVQMFRQTGDDELLDAWEVGLPATLIHPLVFDGADMERAQQPAIKALGAPGTVRYVDDVIRAVLGAVGEVEA